MEAAEGNCEEDGCEAHDETIYSSPHYSWTLLLQPPIRRCDRLGCVHRIQAGRLTARSANILFQVCLPRGSACQDTTGSPTRRCPQTWRSLSFAPWTSHGVLTVSPRTAMNNAG